MSSYKHIILFFLSVYSASSFAPSSPQVFGCHQRRSVSSALGAATTDTSLFYKDHPDDEDLSSFAVTNTRSVNIRQHTERAPPSRPEIYLPRHSDENASKARLRLSEAELVVGRFAMLSAILLFGVEITTGISFPDQLARFFG